MPTGERVAPPLAGPAGNFLARGLLRLNRIAHLSRAGRRMNDGDECAGRGQGPDWKDVACRVDVKNITAPMAAAKVDRMPDNGIYHSVGASLDDEISE